MIKLLEVLQYGEYDIRFNTDIDVMKNPEQIPEITTKAAFAMATTLWGGNEISVLAVLRALTIADLANCANTAERIELLKEASEFLKKSFDETRTMLEKEGMKFNVYGPGIMPNRNKS